MVSLAGVLSDRNTHVMLDACDSVLKTSVHKLRVGRVPTKLAGLWLPLSLGRASRLAGVSYISERDAAADRIILGSARTVIVPPSIPPKFDQLSAFQGPAEQLTVTVDWTSSHNRAGFANLARELGHPRFEGVECHVYGPTRPSVAFPSNMAYRGWANDLVDIYEQNSVFVAPVAQTFGIQNKIWEAICSRRPVIAPDASLQWIPGERPAHVFGYSDQRSLADAIGGAMSQSSVETMIGLRPSDSLSDMFRYWARQKSSL